MEGSPKIMFFLFNSQVQNSADEYVLSIVNEEGEQLLLFSLKINKN